MGNQQSCANPNEVTVTIDNGGGCATWQTEGPMDPRLASFVTADEYGAKMKEVDEIFQTKSPCKPRICFCFGPYLAITVLSYIILMNSVYEDPHKDCVEPNGVCSYFTDATAGRCCNYWCCSSEFDDRIANASTRFVTGIDDEEGRIGYSARLDTFCDWKQTAEECSTSESQEGFDSCGINYSCKKVGKQTVCTSDDGYKCRPILEGETKDDPGVTWPAPLAPLFVIPTIAMIVYSVTYGCRVREPVLSAFADWRARGISTAFHPGSKRSRPRIMFVVPALPQQQQLVMQPGGCVQQQQPGGVMMVPQQSMMLQQQPGMAMPAVAYPPLATSQQFQITVPQGTAPGATLMVMSPAGQQVQVVVPPGCLPGSAFMVSV
jgi:hypothetical protein